MSQPTGTRHPRQVAVLLTGVLLLGGHVQATAGAGSAAQAGTPTQATAPTPEDREGQTDALRSGSVPEKAATPVQLTVDQERQAQRIGTKLHCPICSGESIAQSQTEISRQMMNQVRAGIAAGQSEREILAAFVQSYGERILMEPPRRGIHWLLWTLPLVGLLTGGALWQRYLRRASRPPEVALTPDEERRIAALLRERQGPGEQA